MTSTRRILVLICLVLSDGEDKCGSSNGNRRDGRRFTLAVPITDPLGLRPGKVLCLYSVAKYDLPITNLKQMLKAHSDRLLDKL